MNELQRIAIGVDVGEMSVLGGIAGAAGRAPCDARAANAARPRHDPLLPKDSR